MTYSAGLWIEIAADLRIIHIAQPLVKDDQRKRTDFMPMKTLKLTDFLKRTVPSLAPAFVAALLLSPADLLGREYQLVYYEAGPYPLSRTLQTEYRKEMERLAPAGMDIVYPPNGYLSANWDRDKCKKMARQITRDRAIDLVVAMGPWTVEDLIAAGCKKPIVALGRFDPVLEGIADAKGKPKYENLTVRIRPGKIESDLQALTAIFPARRIGLLYFPAGLESAIVEKYVKRQAEKFGATLVAVPPDPQRPVYEFFKKTKGLAAKIDALYLTPLYGLDLNAIGGFFTHLERENIAVFSSEGFFQVERGAFATNTSAMIGGVALFHADKTIRILKGETPGDLPTVFRDGRRLGLNLPACRRAGIEPSAELIAEARLIRDMAEPGVMPLTLPDAIDQAAQVNPGYLASEQRRKAAESTLGETRADFFPQLSATGFVREFDERPPVNAFGRFRDGRRGYELMLSQKVFDWPSFKSAGAARVAVSRATHDERAAQVELEYQVALAYLNLTHAASVHNTLEAHRERVYRGLQESLTRFQMQRGSRLELIRWEQEKERISAELSGARGEEYAAGTALLALLARPIREDVRIDHGYFAEDQWLALVKSSDLLGTEKKRASAEDFWALEALNRSPLLSSAGSALERQQALLRVNSGSFLPRLEALAGYYSDEQFDVAPPITVDDNGWVVEARLSLPLFEGGRRFKQRSRIKARIGALEFEREQLSLDIVRDVRDSFTKLVSAQDRHRFALRAERLAREGVQISFQSYREGLVTLTDTQLQLDQALAAELRVLETRRDFWAAQLALYRNVGFGFVRRGSPESTNLDERLRAFQQSEN